MNVAAGAPGALVQQAIVETAAHAGGGGGASAGNGGRGGNVKADQTFEAALPAGAGRVVQAKKDPTLLF